MSYTQLQTTTRSWPYWDLGFNNQADIIKNYNKYVCYKRLSDLPDRCYYRFSL